MAQEIDAAADQRRPHRAPGVVPVGEMQGVGTQEPAWLIQREGRYMLVSELVFRLVEQCDGSRTPEEIASGLTQATQWAVTPDDVRTLLERKLVPERLVAPDGAASDRPVPPRAEVRSALQVNLRRRLLGPDGAQLA